MPCVEIARGSILLRGEEAPGEALAAASRRAPSKMREKCGFHGSANDAATQEEGFNLAGFGFVAGYGHANQTVVPKPVPQLDGEDLPSRTAGHVRDLLLGMAPGG